MRRVDLEAVAAQYDSLYGLICFYVLTPPVSEYAKVAGQTNQAWEMQSVYKGFGLQVMNT